MGSMPITLLDFINKRCRSRTAFEGNYKPVSPSTSESSWGGWGPRTVLLAPLVLVVGLAAYLCGYSSHGIDAWIPMGPSRVRLEDGLILRDLAVKHFRLDGGTGQDGGRRLLILQTSDGSGAYSKMLDATMGVQMAYATHWGYSYLRWDGVVRGGPAWLATYNRIYLLHELYQRHEYQWVLFMDPGEAPVT
jgi:hypothetical protein